METCEIEVWVLVDEDGNAVADCNPDHLKDEYEADVGELETHVARRVVKITLTIPKPQAVSLACVIPAEVNAGELKVA